jgi:hypothetical protein
VRRIADGELDTGQKRLFHTQGLSDYRWLYRLLRSQAKGRFMTTKTMTNRQQRALRSRLITFVSLQFLIVFVLARLLPPAPGWVKPVTITLGLLIIFLCEWAYHSQRFRSNSSNIFGRNITAIAMAIVVIFYVAGTILLDKINHPSHETHEMRISSIKQSSKYSHSKIVVLRYINDPERYILIVSKDLGDYLQTLPDDHVSVVFENAYSRDGTKSTEVQIGGMRGWHTEIKMEGKSQKGDVEDFPF